VDNSLFLVGLLLLIGGGALSISAEWRPLTVLGGLLMLGLIWLGTTLMMASVLSWPMTLLIAVGAPLSILLTTFVFRKEKNVGDDV
jgi:hypothetical protein